MRHQLVLLGHLSWHPCAISLLPPTNTTRTPLPISAQLGQGTTAPTARERRQLRHENRELGMGQSWREEVESRLMKKPKKQHRSWKEDLNLDNLALLGPQWWVVRVTRVSTQATSELLAKLLMRDFPEFEFKIYVPSVHLKKRLKNGTYSDKSNPLFPGCIFLYCVLNKDIHDFVRECDKVGGFMGSKVGNKKRQINRPKPVAAVEMEDIFKQAKLEQEQADKALKEELKAYGMVVNENSSVSDLLREQEIIKQATKTRKGSRKSVTQSIGSEKNLITGSSVLVTSGSFSGFTGCLKEVDGKAGKAKVNFMLFGKESLAELNIDHIVPESTD